MCRNLTSNPLACNCLLGWLPGWLRLNSRYIESAEPLYCERGGLAADWLAAEWAERSDTDTNGGDDDGAEASHTPVVEDEGRTSSGETETEAAGERRLRPAQGERMHSDARAGNGFSFGASLALLSSLSADELVCEANNDCGVPPTCCPRQLSSACLTRELLLPHF